MAYSQPVDEIADLSNQSFYEKSEIIKIFLKIEHALFC